MRIKSLSIKNFKGIKSLSINADHKDVNIYGDNATGKTTIFDAFTWLLFDKDSRNTKDFGIKPIDNHTEKHVPGVESEVEAVFIDAEAELTLKKVFSEKWTKQRGSAQAVFTGHTTDYFINGVPVKKGEYEDRIKALGDEKAFKLLTNPLYFNEQLHWQDRRKVLLEVCGDIGNKDVVAANEKLSKLPIFVINGERSIEDHRKVLAAKRKEINEQLEKIPVRIDEVEQGKPVLSAEKPEALNVDIAKLQALKDEKQQAIVRIQSGGEIAQKEKELAEVSAKMIGLASKHEEKIQAELKDLRTNADTLQNLLSTVQRDLNSKENAILLKKGEIEQFEKQIVTFRNDWHKANEESFTESDTCPTCGQSLPEHMVEESISKFNLAKSQKLEKISQQGKDTKSKLEVSKQELEKLESELIDIRTEYKSAKLKLDIVNAQIEDVKSKYASVRETPEYKAHLDELTRLNVEMGNLRAGNQDEVNKLMKESQEFDTDIHALQAELAKIDQIKKAESRIEELKADEKRLAKEYEQVEAELFLTEEFIRSKVSLLTERINGKFSLARFKLFDTQVNGGVAECCETTFQGVPYSDLNNAARINIGLDIINTLSEHYNFNAPIFIDNRESVTRLAEVNTQVISLIVSEQDKTLRVEVA